MNLNFIFWLVLIILGYISYKKHPIFVLYSNTYPIILYIFIFCTTLKFKLLYVLFHKNLITFQNRYFVHRWSQVPVRPECHLHPQCTVHSTQRWNARREAWAQTPLEGLPIWTTNRAQGKHRGVQGGEKGAGAQSHQQSQKHSGQRNRVITVVFCFGFEVLVGCWGVIFVDIFNRYLLQHWFCYIQIC